jgi:mediator of RNA polymerase II transcription subunit 31
MAAIMEEERKRLLEEQEQILRLQYDFEFIQALTSSEYVKHLATSPEKYLEDQKFLNYLEYLRYWKEPEYLRLLRIPYAVDVLEMLLDKNARQELLTKSQTADMSTVITLI